MSEFEKVATVSEIPEGGRKSLLFDEQPVLLFRVAGEFYAVADLCSHDGQPLTDGPLVGCAVECPRHGARFDIRTGRPLCMPAVEPIATLVVQVRGDDILLKHSSG
ncbi:MAG: non-heme iron oxygenase ferredoxin subunit [Planctomycetales bacterium]